MSRFIGDNVRIGVAINAEVNGCTFGETPGDYDIMKIASGGALDIVERTPVSVVEELDVDPRDMSIGGTYYTISFDAIFSYSYREKLFQLFLGGDINTAGADPYTHTFDREDELLFGSFKVEYSDECAEADEFISDTYSNFAVTAITLTLEAEGTVKMSVSGIATELAHSETVASLSTVNHSEVVHWSHFAPEIDDGEDYRLGDISVELTQALTEGDFDLARADYDTMDFVGRDGFRETKWGFTVRMDSDAYDLVTARILDGVNEFAFDNGEAGADNRQCTITLGTSYREGLPRKLGLWGSESAGITLQAMDGSTAAFDIEFVNGRVTIPA
jgi:hypothetical protein